MRRRESSMDEMVLEFPTQDVLNKIKENREKHRATYDEAMQGYRDDLVDATEATAIAAKSYANGDIDHDEFTESYRELTKLSKPSHFLKDYDRAIAMFEATTQDVIDLDMQDFARYMMDEWNWAGQFLASTSSYLTSNKQRGR